MYCYPVGNTVTASLQRGKTPNESPGYDTKQSDCEVPVIAIAPRSTLAQSGST